MIFNTNSPVYDVLLQNNNLSRRYQLIGPNDYQGTHSFVRVEDIIIQGSNGTLPGGSTGDAIMIGSGNTFNFVRVYAGDAADRINASNSSVPVIIYGEAGNDYIIGSAFSDILVGGDGNDIINGNAGRDIIIGGNGVDSLYSLEANVEGLVVSGRTSYDSTASVSLLLSIRNEWTSTRTRSQRMANISGTGTGTRANTVFLTLTANSQSAKTVFDDQVADSVYTDSTLDWVIVS